MSEFQLDLGNEARKGSWYKNLDSFTQGYIEAAFFTDTGYEENGDLENGDLENGDLENASVEELSSEARERIVADCTRFQEENVAAIRAAKSGSDDVDETYTMLGRDFWYTRNRHGVSFLDRDEYSAATAQSLYKAAQAWSEVSLYRGDDGLIYIG